MFAWAPGPDSFQPLPTPEAHYAPAARRSGKPTKTHRSAPPPERCAQRQGENRRKSNPGDHAPIIQGGEVGPLGNGLAPSFSVNDEMALHNACTSIWRNKYKQSTLEIHVHESSEPRWSCLSFCLLSYLPSRNTRNHRIFAIIMFVIMLM